MFIIYFLNIKFAFDMSITLTHYKVESRNIVVFIDEMKYIIAIKQTYIKT